MQISIENIEQREDPYQLFLDHFKNKETKRKYTKSLERFLKLIPNKIYKDSNIEIPNNQLVGSLASCFVLLARKDAKLAQNIIAAYIKEEKKLVENNNLNPNTVPNHIKPIKVLLDSKRFHYTGNHLQGCIQDSLSPKTDAKEKLTIQAKRRGILSRTSSQ